MATPNTTIHTTIHTTIRTIIVGLAATFLMTACSTAPVQTGEAIEPLFTAERILDHEVVDVVDTHDPLEGLNLIPFNGEDHKLAQLSVFHVIS